MISPSYFLYASALRSYVNRKLIRQGGGGYTVYLPKRWVATRGLEDTRQVQITETETALIIMGGGERSRTARVRLSVSNHDDLRTILSHLYRRGFDVIIFENMDSDRLKYVVDATRDV